jgi:hypothetical protein
VIQHSETRTRVHVLLERGYELEKETETLDKQFLLTLGQISLYFNYMF